MRIMVGNDAGKLAVNLKLPVFEVCFRVSADVSALLN